MTNKAKGEFSFCFATEDRSSALSTNSPKQSGFPRLKILAHSIAPKTETFVSECRFSLPSQIFVTVCVE